MSRMEDADKRRRICSAFIFWFGLGLAFFSFISGSAGFWDNNILELWPAARFTALPALICSAAAFIYARRHGVSIASSPEAFAWTLTILFFSDWLCRPYRFFQGPSIRGEIILGGCIGYLILKSNRLKILRWLPWMGMVTLLWSFFAESNGRLLFSDDHSVFMYRLQLLKENLPNVPFYNPLWNGGIHDKSYFNTGAFGVFLLGLPVIHFFDIERGYNLIVAMLVFVFPPLCTYAAAKIMRLPGLAPAFAATLSLCLGLVWVRWALKYGTLGFVMSAGMLPLCLALSVKILDPRAELSKGEALLFLASASFTLMWPLSGLAFLPLLFRAAWGLRSTLKKRFLPALFLGLLVINAPWAAVFVGTYDVRDIFHQKVKSSRDTVQKEITLRPDEHVQEKHFRHLQGRPNLTQALQEVREQASSVNPLILFLFIPGLFLLPNPGRNYFLAVFLWMGILGSYLVPLKPQFELDRMLTFLMMCACLPTAAAIEKMLRERSEEGARGWRMVPTLLIMGFLLAGIPTAVATVRNRSVEHFYFAGDLLSEITRAIKQYGGPGRVLFSGCVVHDLENGHVAPLAYFSGRPLIASSPVHDLWWYTSVFPPMVQAGGDTDLTKYLDLYNVTAVFAHEPDWKEYFSTRPAQFRLVWKGDPFFLFERLDYKEGYFLEGAGKILEQRSGRITLKLDTQQAVIKFNYFPFLTSSACVIGPRRVDYEKIFISLRECPLDVPIVIRALPPIRRIMQGK